MIISKDAGKTFDKTECPFMLITLNKLGIKKKHHNIIKKHILKTTVNIIFNC